MEIRARRGRAHPALRAHRQFEDMDCKKTAAD
jgi:hypothetical protein